MLCTGVNEQVKILRALNVILFFCVYLVLEVIGMYFG